MGGSKLRVVAMPPGGLGLREGLARAVRPESVVTAYKDSALRLAARLLWREEAENEFVPFGDLVGRVQRMAGGRTERLATRGQRDAMVEIACRSLLGETAFERAAKLPGMARLVGERLDQLASHGLGPEELRAAARGLGGWQGERLNTLAQVAELVRDSSEPSHRETVADRISQCLETKLSDPGPLGHLVAILSDEERPLYDRWIEWLNRQGVEVTLLAEVVPGRRDLFLEAQQTLAGFLAADREVVGGERWYERLFTGVQAESSPQVELTVAADALSEAEWVVRGCLQCVEEGVPAASVGIFLADEKSGGPLLYCAAERLGLPLTGVRRVPLLSCGIAVAILALLKALADKDVRSVAALGRSSYFPTEPTALRTLEEQARQSRSGPEAWTELESWQQSSAQPLEWLGRALAWRKEAKANDKTLSKWLELLRQLVGETGVSEASASESDERDARAQTVLQRVVADHAFVYDQAGHPPLSLGQWVRWVERQWKDETVTVAAPEGHVAVFSDPGALPPLSVLFLPGMLEGSVPRRRREDPVLDDDLLQSLNALTGSRLPDSHAVARKERDHFVRLCASASDRLVFSYAVSDDERDNVPAFYLQELERTLGGKVKKVIRPRREFAPRDDACRTPADRALRAALDGPKSPAAPAQAFSDLATRFLRPDLDAGVEVEEIARVLACPFHSAFRDRLGVKSPDLRAGTGTLLELPRLARLAETRTELEGRSALWLALRNLCGRLAPYLEAWESEMLEATGARLIEEWVQREFAAREKWPRTVVSADNALDESGLRSRFKVGGTAIRLKGRVAAVQDGNGTSVVRVYVRDDPTLDELADRVDGDEEALAAGLLLLSQMGRSQGVALEFDALTGRRTVFELPKGSTRYRSDFAAGLIVRSAGESREWTGRAILRRLSEAAEALSRADARATPGRACERCSYGEICRRSPELGDEQSPFGDDRT